MKEKPSLISLTLNTKLEKHDCVTRVFSKLPKLALLTLEALLCENKKFQ